MVVTWMQRNGDLQRYRLLRTRITPALI